MANHRLCVTVILVAVHNYLNSPCQKILKQRRNAIIRPCQFPAVNRVFRQISWINGVQQFLLVPQSSLGENARTITCKAQIVLFGMLWQAKACQHRVHAGGNIIHRIQQGPI